MHVDPKPACLNRRWIHLEDFISVFIPKYGNLGPALAQSIVFPLVLRNHIGIAPLVRNENRATVRVEKALYEIIGSGVGSSKAGFYNGSSRIEVEESQGVIKCPGVSV